jgi:hypothetical protein
MGLLNSTILDVVIGLVFVYLLLALICSTINEWVASGFAIRSTTLAKAIKQMLDRQPGSKDPAQTFLEQFYAHPLISGMMPPGEGHPSYLPSRAFATVVMDITTVKKQGMIAFADLDEGIKGLPDGDVKTALLALIQNANSDLNVAQKNIEKWFDDTMERASGWYKRRTQLITISIAILLTAMANADTVKIARTLWKSPTVRATLVEKAKSADPSARTDVESGLNKLDLVLGWADENICDRSKWPPRLVGWILTVVALSLGAPFWFDSLNKMMNIRGTGKKPETGAEQAQTDKQAKPQTA